MKRLIWKEHSASEPRLPMRVARLQIAKNADVHLHAHRDLDALEQAWRFDVEIDAILEPDGDYPDELTARTKAHAHALAWARELVRKLEEVTP